MLPWEDLGNAKSPASSPFRRSGIRTVPIPLRTHRLPLNGRDRNIHQHGRECGNEARILAGVHSSGHRGTRGSPGKTSRPAGYRVVQSHLSRSRLRRPGVYHGSRRARQGRRRRGPPRPPRPSRGALGLLFGHLGHGEVALGSDATAAARGALVDAGDLGDVDEQVRDFDQVRAGVAAEADDLDADALSAARRGWPARSRRRRTRRRRCRGCWAVRIMSTTSSMSRFALTLPVAVLANVLADDLVAAAAKEGVELALVLVVGVQARCRRRPGRSRGPPWPTSAA